MRSTISMTNTQNSPKHFFGGGGFHVNSSSAVKPIGFVHPWYESSGHTDAVVFVSPARRHFYYLNTFSLSFLSSLSHLNLIFFSFPTVVFCEIQWVRASEKHACDVL